MGDARERLWNAGIIILVVGAALFAAAHTIADPDLWGHVLFGDLIATSGGVPRSDPFSYLSAPGSWVNHEWLAELIFGFAWSSFGTAGLVGLKVLVSLTIVLLAYLHLARRGLDPLRAGVVVVWLVALVRIGIATVRPHLFTYLLFFLVLLVLEAAERGRRRWLWSLPLLFALWANLHGGFLAGLGVLAVWTAARLAFELVGRRREGSPGPEVAAGPPPWPWCVGALAAATAATLINPYGPELLGFLFRTATIPRPEITEWQPLELYSFPGLWYLGFTLLLGVALLRSPRARRPGGLAVLAISALLPLLAIRHLPLFALAGVAIGAEQLAGAFARGEARVRVAPRRVGPRRAIAVVVAGAGFSLAAAAAPRFGCIELEEEYYPVDAVRLLRASGARGNLAAMFNWGEYAIWHLSPRFSVAMDGRRETVYSDSIYQEHLRFVKGIDEWDDLLTRRPTDVALVERGGPTHNLLELNPGWVAIGADSAGSLFARVGWADLERVRSLAKAASGAPRERTCFP